MAKTKIWEIGGSFYTTERGFKQAVDHYLKYSHSDNMKYRIFELSETLTIVDYKRQEMQINMGAINFLKSAIAKGFTLIVITNQGGIAKGLYSHDSLSLINCDTITTTSYGKSIFVY
jgi:hypothetical protein